MKRKVSIKREPSDVSDTSSFCDDDDGKVAVPDNVTDWIRKSLHVEEEAKPNKLRASRPSNTASSVRHSCICEYICI